jgi:hypothetical protein
MIRSLRRRAFFLATALLMFCGIVHAQTQITLTPEVDGAGIRIPEEFSGFSFETELLLPTNGVHYFRADNLPLIQLFKTLGIEHLRIGGNTADNPAVAIPGDADIDSLFGFAHAAGVKVLYTVRLKGTTDADRDVAIVKYIVDHYAADVDCFALGNEPNLYFKEYSAYKQQWEKMTSQIIAAVPQAVFDGPNTDRHYEWAAQFAGDFPAGGRVKYIGEHSYVGLSARKVTDVVGAREKMLSSDWTRLYQGVYDGFVPQTLENHLPYRLEETNTFFNGGKEGASDTYTAALWSLDYMYWWAFHHAAGINFHTGDTVAAGDKPTPCRYAAYVTAAGGYEVRPVGYGIKAFELGAHGSLIPLKDLSTAGLNVSAFAVLGDDRTLWVTVINKEHGPTGRAAQIALAPTKPYFHGETAFLTNASHDIADKTGITVSGSAITNDGAWTGKWSPLPAATASGTFNITVPAASAAVVKLTRDW